MYICLYIPCIYIIYAAVYEIYTVCILTKLLRQLYYIDINKSWVEKVRTCLLSG